MTAFAIRFVSAGLLVASLPLVASRFGDRVAGLLLLFPLVTAAGLLVVGLDRGGAAVAALSFSALVGVPAVVAFLLAVHVTARLGMALPWTLIIGVVAWLIAATVLLTTLLRPGSDYGTLGQESQ